MNEIIDSSNDDVLFIAFWFPSFTSLHLFMYLLNTCIALKSVNTMKKELNDGIPTG